MSGNRTSARRGVGSVGTWIAAAFVAAVTLSAPQAHSRLLDEPTVLVSAVFYDGYLPEDADEAVQLWNVGDAPAAIGGWQISDGEGGAALPDPFLLAPGARLWLARDAVAFRRSFGRLPDVAVEPGATGVARLVTTGGGPRLANGGDEVKLIGARGELLDVAAYGEGREVDGWRGHRMRPYSGGVIRMSNQVLYRKLDPVDLQPVRDTDAATDWSSDLLDPLLGRRARYPGWDLEHRLEPLHASGLARLEVAVAPDTLYEFLSRHLGAATSSIEMAVYSFDNPGLAEVLAARARTGVRVRLLLDGSPAGGIDMNQRWCLAHIIDGGGEVFWLDDGGDVRARYRSAHAKIIVVDQREVLIGSENPSLGAAPNDDRADGTSGRRGVFIATDLPGAVDWASDLLEADLDKAAHVDVRPFQERDPRRGAPPPDFEPVRDSGGAGYFPVAPEPLMVLAEQDMTMISAPENAMHPTEGLLGLLALPGAGDELLVQQLREPLWWGDGPVEGSAARNPRVEAYIDAARRGARVRVMLDGYFDDPGHWNANIVTVNAINGVAFDEGLDLEARLGNPAGRGLHNKMVLVRLAESANPASVSGHWVHVGSLNGTEVAHKVNREVALQLESQPVHDYLAEVFRLDWERARACTLHLPLVHR